MASEQVESHRFIEHTARLSTAVKLPTHITTTWKMFLGFNHGKKYLKDKYIWSKILFIFFLNAEIAFHNGQSYYMNNSLAFAA